MSPRERAAGAVLILPMQDGDVLMDRLTDWCDDPEAFARLIVDAVLDEIRKPTPHIKHVGYMAAQDAIIEAPAAAFTAMIDAIKRWEG